MKSLSFHTPYLVLQLCILLLSSQRSFGNIQAEILQRYSQSPMQLRVDLLKASIQDRKHIGLIQMLTDLTGDHSFNGLTVHHAKLKELLQAQIRARKHREDEEYDEALRAFLKLAKEFSQIGSSTEAAFCYYSAAEVFADQEEYNECLFYLSKTAELIEFGKYTFLEAHYFDSLGYALWFLDAIPDSIRAFSEAAKRWKKINFHPGLSACWNNIAALYEELNLPEQALSCYRKALELATSVNLRESGLSEIEHRIRINLAILLGKRSQTKSALELVRHCQPQNQSQAFELDLAIAEIEADLQFCIHLKPRKPSQKIEQNLLQARILLSAGRTAAAETAARNAVRLSIQSNQFYLQRKSILLLGQVLEKMGNLDESAALYSRSCWISMKAVQRSFPYNRLSSKALDGWIRCLIGQKRFFQAKSLIKHWKRSHYRASENPGIDAEMPVPPANNYNRFLGKHPDLVPGEGYTVVEFWPDGNEINIWIEDSYRRAFLKLDIGESINSLIFRSISPFYRAEETLPHSLDSAAIRTLRDKLVEPLSRLVRTKRVLLVPHKILQIVPFELLVAPRPVSGDKDWIISYLPSFESEFRPVEILNESPVLIMGDEFSKREGASFELEFFRKAFPEVRVVDHLSEMTNKKARWVHLSNHLEWNPFHWRASLLGSSEKASSLEVLLNKRIQCSLLSLAVCDAGNGFEGSTPFWLGISEALLLRGANSLLISRWKLDEVSSFIFVEFFRLAAAGVPLDQALHEARRKLQTITLSRGDLRLSAAHPFFWAGISYIGWPGLRLYEQGAYDFPWSFFWLSFILFALLMTLRISRGGDGNHRR